jgi:hypothetical protein
VYAHRAKEKALCSALLTKRIAGPYGLMRDTGAILLEMGPDQRRAADVRNAIDDRGD